MEKFLQRLLAAKSVLLTTHANPDGDGLGSQMAMHFYLRKKGKTSYVINQGPTPAKFRSVDPENEIQVYRPGSVLPRVELILVFDTNDTRMLGDMAPALKAAGVPVCFVDHHVPEDGATTGHLIDENSAATGEIVFNLIGHDEAALDRRIAHGIYVAIVTDTGGFRYKRTSPRTHAIAAKLLEKGVRPEDVFRDIYSRDSVEKVRLFGHVLDGLQTSVGGRVAWLTVPLATRLKYGATVEDTESFVSSLGFLQGVDIGMLFREEDDGRVKVSLRGSGPFEIVGIAKQFGGGGHRHAAGMKISLPLAEAIRQVRASAESLLAASPVSGAD